MSTKDLVLYGMSANCHAALDVSTQSHRLLGIGTKSRVLSGISAKSRVLSWRKCTKSCAVLVQVQKSHVLSGISKIVTYCLA